MRSSKEMHEEVHEDRLLLTDFHILLKYLFYVCMHVYMYACINITSNFPCVVHMSDHLGFGNMSGLILIED